MVVTDQNLSLRRFAKERNILGPKRTEFNITYGIEYSLVSLFKIELEMKKNIQDKLFELTRRFDFSIHDVFGMLDFFKNGYINEEKYNINLITPIIYKI